jgi:16S rRNA G966 N2-methylase RsmD
VVTADVPAWLGRPDAIATGPFSVVLVDPPYAEHDLLATALAAVGPHLAPGACVVAKHFWRDQPPGEVGLLASERERRFGETALTFYRRRAEREEDR